LEGGGARLSTKGFQLILLSGINFGSAGVPGGRAAELESVKYGPSNDQVIVMPIVAANVALTKSEPGCKIHEATFSILCNTRPGIAGPHKWFIAVRGQTSQETVETYYSAPQISTILPNQVSSSSIFFLLLFPKLFQHKKSITTTEKILTMYHTFFFFPLHSTVANWWHYRRSHW
jgi:hypothetical protein